MEYFGDLTQEISLDILRKATLQVLDDLRSENNQPDAIQLQIWAGNLKFEPFLAE